MANQCDILCIHLPLFLVTLYSVVQFLVHKYPLCIAEKDSVGKTPLHLAAQYGRTEVAEFLIQEGAKVDTRWEHLWVTGFTAIVQLCVIKGS